MLVGCLIRHFKVYHNTVFTPITSGVDGNFAVYTGNNGVGKSSILEAVDHFFHQRKWILNKDGGKNEAYIAPIFLIKKDEFNSPIPYNVLDAISDYFWNVTSSFNATVAKTDAIKEFLSYRDKLNTNYDSNEYYLFLIGMKHYNITPYFATFDNDLRQHLSSLSFDLDDLENIYKSILDFYSYVYIPVESTTKNILKLGSLELQEFMDRDVLNEIDGILNNKIQILIKEPLGSLNRDCPLDI